MAQTDPYNCLTLPGGFVTDRVIGRGAFASVYEGYSPAGERVAVKILHRRDDHARKRFLREIKILRELPPNPHTVGYRGSGATDDGCPYLAMEFVDGVTLTEVLASGQPLDEQTACRVMIQICLGVGALHKLGLAHRDLKPDNIMITRSDQTVKLMDFGLVHDAQGLLKLFEREQMIKGREFAENLEGGVLAGTLEYMAPEQMRDYKHTDPHQMATDTQSDVWSLGVIFYRLLSAQRPFKFSRKASTQQGYQLEVVGYVKRRLKMGDADLPPITSISAELWSVVETALKTEPKLRQGDAAQLIEDIERYLLSGQGVPKDRDVATTVATDVEEIPDFSTLRNAAEVLGVVEGPAGEGPPSHRSALRGPPQASGRRGIPIAWVLIIGLVALLLVGGVLATFAASGN